MTVKIKLCIGSSCFARGNEENLEIVEKFIKKYRIDAEVELSGSRCELMCSSGPNIQINGQWFHQVDRGTLLDLLHSHFPQIKE